jgi:ATP-dependent protease HslVU (ClpYQ) peptidase subunit
MTVIVGIKVTQPDGSHRVVMAADSAVSTDDSRLYKVKNSCKLVEFNGFILGLNGSGPILEVLEDIKFNTDSSLIRVSNRREAVEFARLVFSSLLTELETAVLADKDRFLGFIGQLFIATSDSIYVVFNDLSCYEFEEYMAVGSGESVAKGALHVAYTELTNKIKNGEVVLDEDLETAARFAVEAACIHNPFCAEPIDIKVVPVVSLPQVKKRGRRRK